MNKEVIYIEPDDDITDIINKVKTAEKKVVALVPPKKIGIMRSAVNTKLLAKAAKSSDKAVVMITTDSSLTKLAAAAGMPVATSLQSRPKMPEEIDLSATNTKDPISIDERDADDDDSHALKDASESATKSSMKNQPRPAKKEDEVDEELNSVDLENEAKKSDKKKSGDKDKGKGKLPDLDKYRKWIIIGAVALVAFIIFLVWAIVFAPATTINVSVRTTANNFAEDVKFTTVESSAEPEKGKFYLVSEKVEKENSVEFTATGERDEGTKASGSLSVTATIKSPATSVSVPSGSKFTYNGLTYTTNNSANFTVNDEDDCPTSTYVSSGCKVSATLAATAAENGDKYNISQTGQSFSSSISGVSATNSTAFSGGSSKIVKYVKDSDVADATSKLKEQSSEEVTIDDLKKSFGDDMYIIESSFKKDVGDVVSSPKANETVSDNSKAKLTAKTTYSVYAVKKADLAAFITKVTEEGLGEDQRLYDIGNPFIEKFTGKDKDYTGRLKTTTQTGPKVSEADILEKSKGKKNGEVVSLLKSINGVSTVDVKPSYFWVTSVPNDESKITINLGVEK